MKYKIALRESEEGFSVSVPGLPGCWSQGATEHEALQNIQDAIKEYLATVETCSRAPRSERSKSKREFVGKLPGVPHLEAVRALQKAGFRVVRQGKHVVMSDGTRILTIPSQIR